MSRDAEFTSVIDDLVGLAEVTSDSKFNPVRMRADSLYRAYRKFYIGDREDFRQTAIVAAIEFSRQAGIDTSRMSLTRLLEYVTVALRRECNALDRITENSFRWTKLEDDSEYKDATEIAKAIRDRFAGEEGVAVKNEFRRLLTLKLGPAAATLLWSLYIENRDPATVAAELYPKLDAETALATVRDREAVAINLLYTQTKWKFTRELQESFLATLRAAA
jgi:hypothetical protein